MDFIDFGSTRHFGSVLRVDTSEVVIDVEDHDLVTKLQVGGLVAVQAELSTKFLIGVIASVSRDFIEPAFDFFISQDLDSDDEPDNEYGQQRDIVRLVLIGTYFSRRGAGSNQFRRGADSFPSVTQPCWYIEGSNLQKLMQGLVETVDPEKRLVLGRLVADSSVEAVADGDSLFQRHCAVVGSTGSGKSWTAALLLEQAEKLPYSNLIVFDVHGEYANLCTQFEDNERAYRHFKVAGTGMSLPEQETPLHIPYWLLNFEELQAFLLDRTDQNAPNQSSRLMHHVRELKRDTLNEFELGESDENFTVNSPIPFSIEDLIHRLTEDDRQMVPGAKGREKQGDFHGKLSRFITRLQTRLGDGRLSFMFQLPEETSQGDWFSNWAATLIEANGKTSGIKILDLSEVPSDILPLITSVLGRLLLEIQFWRDSATRTPLVMMCDEAHLYISSSPTKDSEERRAAEVFERIAKEGRKYGTTLTIISQRPAELSATLLSQVNNFIVLRLTNDTDRLAIKSLLPDSMSGLVQSLQLLDVGEALVVGDSMLLPSRIRLNSPAKTPGGSTYPVWEEWASNPSSKASISSAVDRMRAQRRI